VAGLILTENNPSRYCRLKSQNFSSILRVSENYHPPYTPLPKYTFVFENSKVLTKMLTGGVGVGIKKEPPALSVDGSLSCKW
jgi:hypothetical protein